jgi:Family of unknown function (DUF6339)
VPEVFLFPRLPVRAARARFGEVTGKTVSELGLMAAGSHPDAVYPATGGVRVTEQRLLQVRAGLLECACQLGFPNPAKQEALVSFDAAAAPVLLSNLPITAGEASHDEVWSFLSLVLAPDLATWRFSDQNERRLLGGIRNTFQRIWWRAHLLHSPADRDPWELLRLPEDALVGLMERPGISSNPAVTRTIARGIADIASRLPGDLREDSWRDAYKRIRQRFPLVNLDALAEQEVAAQIDSICGQTIAQALASKQNRSRK